MLKKVARNRKRFKGNVISIKKEKNILREIMSDYKAILAEIKRMV